MNVWVCFVAKKWKTKNLSLSIINDEWPGKMVLWICKVTAYTHIYSFWTGYTLFHCTHTYIIHVDRLPQAWTLRLYLYVYLLHVTQVIIANIWYGCYHNLRKYMDKQTNTRTHTHTTITSSIKSSIIPYYLLGPSTMTHTTPFWNHLYCYRLSRFDLHLIKCIINNSIAYSVPFILTANETDFLLLYCSFHRNLSSMTILKQF